jgi:hypothetical protein
MYWAGSGGDPGVEEFAGPALRAGFSAQRFGDQCFSDQRMGDEHTTRNPTP